MHSLRILNLIIGLMIIAGLVTACAPAPVIDSSAPTSAAPTSAAPGAKESFAVSGAFALFPLMNAWAEEYKKVSPNIQFDIQAGGAGKGMTDLLSGAADIAMLSREPRKEELDKGAFVVPVTIDSVVAVVNANNPHLAALREHGITGKSAAGAWISGTAKTWGQLLTTDAADPINVYTRSDSSGAAEMWAKFLGAKAQEDLKGTGVNGDPGLAEAVRQDKFGIGYNNVGFAFDPATGKPVAGLAIVPIDLNGDGRISADEDFYASRDQFTAAVKDGRYPFPPARVLYLVTKGKPAPAIKQFLHWVLQDGQKLVQPTGYVPLTAQKIADAAASLDK